MGNPDQGGVHHVRMVVEHVLDLDAVDVLAAADQHVLGPVDDEHEALLVEAGQVAGAQPAVPEGLGGGLGLVPVELHHLRALDPQLADRPDGQDRHAVGGVADLHLADRGGGPGAVRAGLVVPPGMAGEGGGGLGHAPAVAGGGAGEDLDDAAHQFRSGGRPAVGDGDQGGEVVLRPGRMLDQLPGDGRDPARGVDALALDQLHGLLGLPAAHEHDLAAGVHGRPEGRGQAGGVEQGHDQEGAALGQLVRVALRQGLAGPQEVPRRADPAGHDVGGHVAVGAQGALRPARRARGVEDGGVVVGVDGDVRQRRVRQVLPAVDGTDHALEAHRPRTRVGAGGKPGDVDLLEVRQFVQVRGDALQPLVVHEGDPGPGVGQAVLELGSRPPSIQRRDDRTGEDAGVEGHRPFGQVAHDHRDPVALADPVRLELAGQGDGGAGKGLVGRAVVLVDQELPRPEGPAVQEDVPQGRRRVLPGPLPDAPDDKLFHLEALARRRQARVRLGDRHDGPFGSGVGRHSGNRGKGRERRDPDGLTSRRSSKNKGAPHPGRPLFRSAPPVQAEAASRARRAYSSFISASSLENFSWASSRRRGMWYFGKRSLSGR